MSHTILVVDDEADIRKFITAVLKKSGYETLTAENGKRGTRRVEKSEPGSDHPRSADAQPDRDRFLPAPFQGQGSVGHPGDRRQRSGRPPPGGDRAVCGVRQTDRPGRVRRDRGPRAGPGRERGCEGECVETRPLRCRRGPIGCGFALPRKEDDHERSGKERRRRRGEEEGPHESRTRGCGWRRWKSWTIRKSSGRGGLHRRLAAGSADRGVALDDDHPTWRKVARQAESLDVRLVAVERIFSQGSWRSS